MSENYVLQMASSSTYAFFQSAVEFPHSSLQHLIWDTTNFVLGSLFQFIQCPWPSRVDPILKVAPPKKKNYKRTNPVILGARECHRILRWHVYRTVLAQLPLIALQCAMSHHPVETRLGEVVENCSVQVQQKIAASQHTHFKFPFFCVTLHNCHLVDFQVTRICITNYKEGMRRNAWQSEKRCRSHRRTGGLDLHFRHLILLPSERLINTHLYPQ